MATVLNGVEVSDVGLARGKVTVYQGLAITAARKVLDELEASGMKLSTHMEVLRSWLTDLSAAEAELKAQEALYYADLDQMIAQNRRKLGLEVSNAL